MAMKKEDAEDRKAGAQDETALVEKTDETNVKVKKPKKEKKKKPEVEIVEVTGQTGGMREYTTPKKKFPVILAVVIIVLILLLAAVGGYVLLNMAGTYTSSEYSMEQYTYNGVQYVGNRRFNKPDGLNLTHAAESFNLGEFKGSAISGYGMVHAGETTNLGVFKKNNPKGYQIHKNGDVYWITQYKKDRPKGYAYKIDGDEHSIVKMKVKADYVDPDYSDYETLVAVNRDGTWVTPNGKELKIKENRYKDFEWVDLDTLFIKGATYEIGESLARYSNDDVKMTYEGGEATYDTTGDGARDGLIVHLDKDGLDGQNVKAISNGSKVENFELKIKDMANEDVD